MDRPRGYIPGAPLDAAIVVYFADDDRKIYQLRQWLPVFEVLNRRHRVVIVTADARTYTALGRLTGLRVLLVPTWPDLAELYETSPLRMAIYVNNSTHNFLSLTSRTMAHVHVNHGESDKVCMVSNQVKAYDRVFVAGEAAILRHRAALIEFDERKLVPVGRPQLDLRPEPALAPSGRPTILYAPTWEGENSSNDYTSVQVHGPRIVAAALAVPGARVVYKPHPRVVSTGTPGIVAAHRRIVALLEQARCADPAAGHSAELDADILAVIPGCDLMITDVSSVGLDFLYLNVDKPMFVADRYGDRALLHAEAPVSRCADVIDAATIGGLTEALAARLAHDEHRAGREQMRRHYFGDLAPGESTRRFLAAVDGVLQTWGGLHAWDVLQTRDELAARTDHGRGGPDRPAAAPGPTRIPDQAGLPHGSLT